MKNISKKLPGNQDISIDYDSARNISDIIKHLHNDCYWGHSLFSKVGGARDFGMSCGIAVGCIVGVLGYDRKRIFRPDTGLEPKSSSGITGNGMLFHNSGSG